MQMLLCLSAVGLLAGVEPQGKEGPVELTLIAKKTTYAWDAGGLTPEEFRKQLDKLKEDSKKKGGFGAKLPPAPVVDLVLKFTNTGKEAVTIYLGGDPNQYVFELKGPGVVTMPNPGPMTLEFRNPKAVTLKPGESHEIVVTKLMDGMRGVGRAVYWTEVGDYTLSAAYQLSDAQGQRTAVLKSEPVKLKVEMKK